LRYNHEPLVILPLIDPDENARQPRGIHQSLVKQAIEQLQQIKIGQTFVIAISQIARRKYEVVRALIHRAAAELGLPRPSITYDKKRDALLVQRPA
jgi:hypothetical protein